MVWFQCEDCGENLKKPKLPNHFRICSAFKLSCIDCGEIFGQEAVQAHTQCITEAEKYGPKGGQGKASNGATPKTNKDSKKQADVDINVGLSQRPPWFCSLCNTKATSQQTLLLHADGKKHRAKARAFHGAKQPKQTEEPAPKTNAPTENTMKGELHDNKHVEEQNVQDTPQPESAHTNSEIENGKVLSKKRKLDASGNDDIWKKTRGDATDEVGNGVIQVEKARSEELENKLKKAKQNVLKDDKAKISGCMKEETKQKINWKKTIKSALKSNDGALKMRKLKKLVLKSLQESGITDDETQLSNMLKQKINSSSRFRVDEKYVRLVPKD